MNRLPTLAQLERASADRKAVRQNLAAANSRWKEWFSEEPPHAGKVTQ